MGSGRIKLRFFQCCGSWHEPVFAYRSSQVQYGWEALAVLGFGRDMSYNCVLWVEASGWP